MIDVEFHTTGDIQAEAEEIVAIYRTVFALPPYNEPPGMAEEFSTRLTDEHAHYAGFKCVLAKQDDRLVGFAYGYRSEAGQFWHDVVRSALSPDVARAWMDDAFEFVELAVLPDAQGAGIGSRLHDALLTNRPERTAIATTVKYENPALDFYLRRGWVALHENFYFPGVDEPQVIIGRSLQSRSA